MKSNGPLSSLKFYTTFGHQRVPRTRRRATRWLWLWLAIGILTLLGIAGILILTARTYRTDYETTRLPPFKQNLTLGMSTSRFQVGDSGTITVALGNPGAKPVTIKTVQVDLPKGFLDAFIVDDSRAIVDHHGDGSGTITYRNLTVVTGKTATIAVPLQAERTGNFQSEIRATLVVAVPVDQRAWYMPLDDRGNYLVTLQRSITRDLTVVLKK